MIYGRYIFIRDHLYRDLVDLLLYLLSLKPLLQSSFYEIFPAFESFNINQGNIAVNLYLYH